MMNLRHAAVVCLTATVVACHGSSPFIPATGPFVGGFTVAGQAIGECTFTTGGGFLAGTGTLVHNGQTVTVSISAIVTDRTIEGTVANASLGGGAFTGSFANSNRATGEFNYTDTAGLATTLGTWETDATSVTP